MRRLKDVWLFDVLDIVLEDANGHSELSDQVCNYLFSIVGTLTDEEIEEYVRASCGPPDTDHTIDILSEWRNSSGAHYGE